MKKLQYVGKGKKRVSMAVMAAVLMISMTACGSTTETDAAQDVKETVEAAGTASTDATGAEKEGASAEQQTGAGQNEPGQLPEEMMQGDRYFGEITAIEGNTITVEAASMNRNAGEMPEGMNPGEKPEGEAPSGTGAGEKPTGEGVEGQAPDKPDGENGGSQPQGDKPDGENAGSQPQGEKPSGEAPEGMAAGEKPDGMTGGERPEGEAPAGADFAEMERETMTIEVTDTTVITVNGETADLSELQVGDSIMFTMEEGVVTNISVGMMDSAMPETSQSEPSQQ